MNVSRKIQLALICLFVFGACVCSRDQRGSASDLSLVQNFRLDQPRAQKNLQHFAQAPHPFGSENQKAISDWLLEKSGGETQPFKADTPNPVLLQNPDAPAASTIEKKGQNIFRYLDIDNSNECLILFGSHYDTKIIEGISYTGANDSGSSSILLLELLAYLEANKSKIESDCDFGFVWFDGEESILPEWNDGLRKHIAKIQDNTYGSRHFVGNLAKCADKTQHCLPIEDSNIKIRALILLDMVGMKKIQLTMDSNSTSDLRTILKDAIKDLNMEGILSPVSRPISDDHLPFIKAGIPAIDLIDFHNTHTWHKDSDTLDKISYDSIEKAGKIALYIALSDLKK